MKKIYFEKTKTSLKFLLIASVAISSNFSAQCLNADVILNTQQQVNTWATNFPNCTRVAHTLRIGAPNNSDPGDITDLSPLGMINEISGSLVVQNNALLESLQGLKVTKIGGRINIGGEIPEISNLKLKNLEGLNQVTSVGQFLMIRNNPLLENLNALSNLTSIAEDIEISGNTVLTDISALRSTTFNATFGLGLSIFDNPLLSVCNLPNFCGYISNDAETHPRMIFNNLTNCLDEDAVVSACESLLISDIEKSEVSIYPNPVRSELTIISKNEASRISIYNVAGQLVKDSKITNNKVNISNLTSGNYIGKVTLKNGKTETVKIIKQ